MRQGCKIQKDLEFAIVRLLSSTNMGHHAIAERFNVSVTAVRNVNARHQIRKYNGNRSCWQVNGERRAIDE